jgi:enamine deaminase RidA (YjgF/YER057c/UK114 family)
MLWKLDIGIICKNYFYMMKSILIISLTLMAYMGIAQEKKHINPRPVGYSDAVVVSSGKTIYISGQVPLNSKSELVGKGDLRAQTIQVFENLKNILAQSGATFQDVVKVSTYIVNCKPSDVALVREIRKSYLAEKSPPASTMVGVTSLVDPDFLIEIEVIAVID